MPNGYISNQEELIQTLRERMGMMQQNTSAAGAVNAGQEQGPRVEGGTGYGELQRAINQTGMEGMDLSQIQV